MLVVNTSSLDIHSRIRSSVGQRVGGHRLGGHGQRDEANDVRRAGPINRPLGRISSFHNRHVRDGEPPLGS
jgi:hypothetical protein